MRPRRRQLRRARKSAYNRLARLQAFLVGCSESYRERYIRDVLSGDRPYPKGA